MSSLLKIQKKEKNYNFESRLASIQAECGYLSNIKERKKLKT